MTTFGPPWDGCMKSTERTRPAGRPATQTGDPARRSGAEGARTVIFSPSVVARTVTSKKKIQTTTVMIEMIRENPLHGVATSSLSLMFFILLAESILGSESRSGSFI